MRKAKNTKNTPFTLEMAEVFFGTIQADFVSLKEEMNSKFEAVYRRFEKVDSALSGIVKTEQRDKLEREEIKLNLWENNQRIAKLQKQLAKI